MNEIRLAAWKTEVRICLECGKEFIPNRRHQKFCSAHCRVLYGSKLYSKRHPEKRRELCYAWREKNRERYLENARRYWHEVNYPKHKERIKQRTKAYALKNMDKVRQYRKEYNKLQKKLNIRSTPITVINGETAKVIQSFTFNDIKAQVLHSKDSGYFWVAFCKGKKVLESAGTFTDKKMAVKDIKTCFA